MTNKDLLALVSDFSAWQGNSYTLANIILQKQREDDALIAESSGQQDVADLIRASC